MGSKSGYEIGRDEQGLTLLDRQVLTLISDGESAISIGRRLGLSRQRVYQVIKRMEDRDVLTRPGRGKIQIEKKFDREEIAERDFAGEEQE